MNNFLEALDGYVPLMQSLIWVLFLIVCIFIFRKDVLAILSGLRKRIDEGAEVKIAGLEVGTLVRSTADLPSEVKTFGDPDQLKLLFKAQGKGWKKSTKALQLPQGCLVQVTTERQSINGDWENAEALVFVPDVKLSEKADKIFEITKI